MSSCWHANMLVGAHMELDIDDMRNNSANLVGLELKGYHLWLHYSSRPTPLPLGRMYCRTRARLRNVMFRH
jgi:hypothetical protein